LRGGDDVAQVDAAPFADNAPSFDAVVARDLRLLRHRAQLRERIGGRAIDGAVDRTSTYTLAQLRAMPQQTQITRHDCVEGWSVIGKWSGVHLGDIVAAAQPREDARYVVFHCFDRDDQGTQYYESLDLHQAMHPQALLGLRLNGADVDADHGAPVRLRVPTQLGYKSAKWISRIEVVGSFANIEGGHGGYWEDQGYEWYAGI